MFSIGLDFDGLFHDLASLTHMVLRDLFGRTMPHGREHKDLMVADGVVTHEEYKQLATELCCTDKYLPHMVPLPGVSRYFPLLRKISKGNVVRIITARKPEGAVVAQKWAKALCLDGAIVESSNATGSKGPHAEGLHVYVDDDIQHLHEVEGIVPYRFLFSWPYNEMETHDVSIIRVRSWEELYGHVQSLKNTYS
jgi:hypothetical protein